MNEKDEELSNIPVNLSAVIEMLDGDKDALSEVVNQFLETCPDQMAKLKGAIDYNECKKVEKLAHSIKGLTLNFRAKKANKIAYELEKSGENKAESKFIPLFNNLSIEINNVVNFFKAPDWLDKVFKEIKK